MPNTPVPLVLALHYGVGGAAGSGAGGALVRSVVGPAFAELGAIIIAPDSLGGDWSAAQNEDAVHDLIENVLANYAVDTKKIAVTGYSMGGAGTWHIAEKFPQRFSAAIPVSGRPPASAAGWKLPVFAVNSRDDQVMPFAPTEARITELQKAGVNAKLLTLTGITHFEMNRFVPALRQAVPWLREVWLRESPK
jgi:predicted peptidase